MAYRYNDKRIYDPLYQNDPNRVDNQLDLVDNVTDAMKGVYAPINRRSLGIPMKGFFQLTNNSVSQVPTAIDMNIYVYTWTSNQNGGEYYNDHVYYAHGRDIITDITAFSGTNTIVGMPVSMHPDSTTGFDITKMGEWTQRVTGASVSGAHLLITVPNHGFPANLANGAFLYATAEDIEDISLNGVGFTVVNSNTLSITGGAGLYGNVFSASGVSDGFYLFCTQGIQIRVADLSGLTIYLTYHIGDSGGRPTLGTVND